MHVAARIGRLHRLTFVEDLIDKRPQRPLVVGGPVEPVVLAHVQRAGQHRLQRNHVVMAVRRMHLAIREVDDLHLPVAPVTRLSPHDRVLPRRPRFIE